MKRKLTQVLLIVASVLLWAYYIHDFINMAHRNHRRALMEELEKAPINLKAPPGIARAEEFVRRLKDVDTRFAPDEVKSALHDYITSLNGALDAMKSGRDTTPYDKPIAESKDRLTESVLNYK